MANRVQPLSSVPRRALAGERVCGAARPRRRAQHLAAPALLFAALAAPSAALAQGVPHEAQKLYGKAAGAMIKKDYATACPTFVEVTRIVPDGGGVRLNLAECYEEWGKLASALAQYEVAQELAKKDGRKDRQVAAAKAVDRLKPKIATLVVTVPQSVRSAPGLIVKLDDEVLDPQRWGAPVRIDKGTHTLVATADGHKPATMQIDIPKDGAKTEVSVPALEIAPPEPAPSASATAESAPPAASAGRDRSLAAELRVPGLITGGALTAGGLVLGGVFLGLAASEDAKIKGTGPFDRAIAQDAARAKAADTNTALWGFVGAGVAAAGTVAFYFITRPKKAEVKGAISVSPVGPTLLIEGQF